VGGTAEKILSVAIRLFAERGYEGTSVRAICEGAGANVNAVSYHYGGKRGLYEEVVSRSGDQRLRSAQRILGRPPKDARDLANRLLLFAEEVLATNMAEPELLIILFAEFQQGYPNCDGASVKERLLGETKVLVDFLRAARRRKLLRKGVDPELVAGALTERIYSQVRYAEAIQSIYGESVKSPEYLRKWTQQTVDLLLYGAARTPPTPKE